MKLTLASTSKFKSDIMNTVKLNHFLIESDFEEISSNFDDVYKYVEDLALGKAMSVLNKVDSGIILGLDTVVYVDGKILEKPKDLDEVREFLRLCSNNTTSVITGIAMINKDTNKIIKDTAKTEVTLRNLSDKDIEYYIENEPDKMYVSGFVIETVISNFIEKINGSYYNILGIPVETIYKHLEDLNIHLYDLEKDKN